MYESEVKASFVEGFRVSGTDEVEVEGRGWDKWYATGVTAVAVGEFGVE